MTGSTVKRACAFAVAAALVAAPAIYVRAQTDGFAGGWVSRMTRGCGGMMGGGMMGGGTMDGGTVDGGRPNQQWRR